MTSFRDSVSAVAGTAQDGVPTWDARPDRAVTSLRSILDSLDDEAMYEVEEGEDWWSPVLAEISEEEVEEDVGYLLVDDTVTLQRPHALEHRPRDRWPAAVIIGMVLALAFLLSWDL